MHLHDLEFEIFAWNITKLKIDLITKCLFWRSFDSTWPTILSCAARLLLSILAVFGNKFSKRADGKLVLIQNRAKTGSQIWYLCKAETVTKPFIAFSARQSTAIMNLSPHEKNYIIFCHNLSVSSKITSERSRILLLNFMVS